MNIVCVDVETSDLSPLCGGRVIEVGAVAIERGDIIKEFSTLIDVDCTIHRGAERVHSISRAMLRGFPPPEVVWPAFLEFVGDSALVAHNARFDVSFLRFELARLGMSFSNRIHCSLETSRRKFPHLPNHRLETVAQYILGGIPDDCRLHRAQSDARLLARIWVALDEGKS